MRIPRAFIVTATLALLLGLGPSATFAAPKAPALSVTWQGQGSSLSDGTRVPISAICGLDAGAPVAGKYFDFVLASTKSLRLPMISFGSDSSVPMEKSNSDKFGTSSYKARYTGGLSLDQLLGEVTVTYTGAATPTLTLSQGCAGEPSGLCATDPLAGSTGLVIHALEDGRVWSPAPPNATYYLKPFAMIDGLSVNLYLPDNGTLSAGINDGCLQTSAYFLSGGSWVAWPTGSAFAPDGYGGYVYSNPEGQPADASWSGSVGSLAVKFVYVWTVSEGNAHTYTFYRNYVATP